MKRIFYFNSNYLTAFHWRGNRFEGCYSFASTGQGLDDFSKYLASIDTGSVKLLADVLEEDFVKESIPHVGYRDRRALTRRYINRQYRKSNDYYTCKVIGREKKGRKDDLVLYSVITNPDIIGKWLNIIQKNNVPISGIWSLPLVSEGILNHVTSDKGNVLLVSQQVATNLRQSFFINGRFEISRNAVINLDDMSLGEYINEEVEQTSRFLANQRYIGFDDIVNIHVICDRNETENIKAFCEDTPLKIFHYHSLDEVKKSCDCVDVTGDLASGLFANQCKLKNDFSGHYGSNKSFQSFHQKILNNGFLAINLTVFLLACTIMLKNVINAQVLKAEAAVLSEQKNKILSTYNQNYLKIENELNHAVAMQSSVMFYDRVDSLKNISPQYFMNKFSDYLHNSGVQTITITDVAWSSRQGDTAVIDNRNIKDELSLSSNEKIRHFAKIKGYIGTKDDNYDAAVKKVAIFLSALNKHKDIEKLDIIKMPFDIRSQSDLSNSHSYDKDEKKQYLKHRDFELNMLLKGEGSV